MFTSSKRKFLILFLVSVIFTASGMFSYAASTVSIKSYNSPSSLKKGQSFSIKGTLRSAKKMKRVEIGIVTKNGKWTKYKYDKKKLNSKTFNIRKASGKLKFGKLKAGTYYYRIYVHTNDRKVHTVLNKKFKVRDITGSPGKISLSGFSYPSKIIKGSGFYLKGKIKASKKIKKVTVGVAKTSGAWTSVKSSMNVNSKSFDVSKIDAKVKFGKLSVGKYSYKIVIATVGGTATVLNHSFTVVEKSTPTPSPVIKNVSPTNVSILTDNANGELNGQGVVTLSGVNKPGNYKIGSKFNPVGTIKSNELIKRVEIGIVYGPTNKWLSHKYDNNNVNATDFKISEAAGKLSFDTLPAGIYRYRIYVHTESGIYLVLNHPFKVTGSGKPEAAVSWAIKIANDDSFAYGKVPTTSRVGCYFCGTNQKNKPKGYEKTYVCMTFAHAAFAHGANDPELLHHCKGGKYCISLNDRVFKEYTCWEKIGYCSDLNVKDLLPGDIICWYADDDKNGHLSIYTGDDNIVDAGRVGWGADSIALRNGSASYYLRQGVKHSKKSFVMRYRK